VFILLLGSVCSSNTQQQRVAMLRSILSRDKITIMPCCGDGLSARLIEEAGFDLTFMSGFATAAVHGLPDTGLITSEELVASGAIICSALKEIPCIGDGDTGFGNSQNIKRTMARYAQAGFAGIMIEDQVSPKRCGHLPGKQVVDRDEACMRIQAAVDARNEGVDLVILARTDARQTHSLQEAIQRCQLFKQIGADWTFLEAPQSVEEMKEYCKQVPGPKLANMLEGGLTPVLSPDELEKLGYTVAAYPLTLLSVSIKAMQDSLKSLKAGVPVQGLLPFKEMQKAIGVDDYMKDSKRYP